MFDPSDIRVIHCKRKGLRIKALGGGKLEVRAPLGTRLEDVLKSLARIEDKLRKMMESYEHKHQPRSYADGSTVLFMGNPLIIRLLSEVTYLCKLEDDTLLINQRYANQIPAVLKAFYTQQAKRLIIRAYELQEQYGFPIVKISTRWNKGRWGSCSPKGNISLNAALIMAPQEVTDYVIIHEFCHIKHPNHSAAFWNSVEEIVPDYRVHYRWLKENGYLLRVDI